MASVSTTQETKPVQDVTSNTPQTDKKETAKSDSKFEAIFAKLVSPDQADKINEEELFAGVVRDRIQALKGDDAASKYDETLEKFKASGKKPNGFVSYEECAMNALKSLKESGDLTAEEADQIYAESFRASQLDDNLGKLYDGRGGKGDSTIATAERSAALAAASEMVAKIASGEVKVDAMSLDSAESGVQMIKSSTGTVSGGSPVDGPDGFLWKPVGDHSKQLVVLLPAALTGNIASMVLKDDKDEVIEEGRYSGIGNGDRTHFRFNRSGGDYPANLKVEVKLDNGEIVNWNIEDPAQRYD